MYGNWFKFLYGFTAGLMLMILLLVPLGTVLWFIVLVTGFILSFVFYFYEERNDYMKAYKKGVDDFYHHLLEKAQLKQAKEKDDGNA